MVRVGIVGITGYTGIELFRILASHPEAQVAVVAARSQVGTPLATAWPGLSGRTSLTVEAIEAEALAARCDLVFLGLPHGVSAPLAAALLEAGCKVVDLGADFRLREQAVYEAAYGSHPVPGLLSEAVYGLPELNREALRGSRLVANPGCYPTATTLAALPLVEAGLCDHVVASCVSGVSGAGRSPGPRNLFCEVQESVVAYGVGGAHRHVPEIEQSLGVPVSFTPHLVPMRRGMLATVTVRLLRPVSTGDLRALFAERYAGHPAVVLREEPPATAHVRGTAAAHVFVVADPPRGTATAICAIDNLGKGAAGQAVHNMNLATGLPETAGLPMLPLIP